DRSERHEWERRSFREKTRFVCERCNHGWMSDLEGAARPILEPSIRHERCLFTRTAQLIGATWAFKTCLVFQGTQVPEPLAPRAHFVHLQRNRTPPMQVAIWIGSNARVRHDPGHSVFIQRPMGLELDDQLIEDAGYLCFLAI